MRVTATHVGFYVKLRKPGDEFDISDASAFSERWMKRVEEPAAEPAEPEPVAELVTLAVEPVVKKRRGRKPKAVSE